MSALLQGPIPGQSLTNSKDTPMPFEGKPEFTKLEDATQYLFESLTEPETATEMIELMSKGMPVDMLAQSIAYSGFSKGKWTPDLLLLLLEPIVYIIIFIAEQAGVDYVLEENEMVELMDPEDEFEVDSILSGAKKKVVEKVKGTTTNAEDKLGSLLGKVEEKLK